MKLDSTIDLKNPDIVFNTKSLTDYEIVAASVEALEATKLLLCYQLKSDLVFHNKQTVSL